jgi:hypothetical protein
MASSANFAGIPGVETRPNRCARGPACWQGDGGKQDRPPHVE